MIILVIKFQGRDSSAALFFNRSTEYSPYPDMWIHYDPQRELLSMLFKCQGMTFSQAFCQLLSAYRDSAALTVLARPLSARDLVMYCIYKVALTMFRALINKEVQVYIKDFKNSYIKR